LWLLRSFPGSRWLVAKEKFVGDNGGQDREKSRRPELDLHVIVSLSSLLQSQWSSELNPECLEDEFRLYCSVGATHDFLDGRVTILITFSSYPQNNYHL
jgi:hypothetical protein